MKREPFDHSQTDFDNILIPSLFCFCFSIGFCKDLRNSIKKKKDFTVLVASRCISHKICLTLSQDLLSIRAIIVYSNSGSVSTVGLLRFKPHLPKS